jgi:hypothetical protein
MHYEKKLAVSKTFEIIVQHVRFVKGRGTAVVGKETLKF